VSAHDLVHSLLTVLFAAVAVHGVYRCLVSRGAGWRGRGDQLLHTAMALAMAVMPWSRGALSHHPAQVTFFATAAIWFPLTAVRRRHESRFTALARRLPSTAGMAAMAWMAWAAHPAAGHAHENRATPPTTALLALSLLTCALWSLIRVMPPLRDGPTLSVEPIDRHQAYLHFWDGTMALGTTVMLLMPH
jgi:hypothetical protein